MKRHHAGIDLRGKMLGLAGRPEIMPFQAMTELRGTVEAADASGSSMTTTRLKLAIDDQRQKQILAAGGNALTRLPGISMPTMRKIMSGAAPDTAKKGAARSRSRVRAEQEWHNGITEYAIISHFAELPRETMVSVDAVAVVLGKKPGDKPTVHMAAGTKDYLRAHNLSPGAEVAPEQFRMAHCLITHNAAGNVVHAAVLIKDTSITKTVGHPISPSLSVWLVNPKHDKRLFFQHYFEHCLLSPLEKIRKDLVQSREERQASPKQYDLQDDPEAFVPRAADMQEDEMEEEAEQEDEVDDELIDEVDELVGERDVVAGDYDEDDDDDDLIMCRLSPVLIASAQMGLRQT
jgi:hypothetical protein